MSAKKWVHVYLVIQLLLLAGACMVIIVVDPYFHYHKPLKGLFYDLDISKERSINDGIVKRFDYDALITGTSMTQCFKTTEADELFGANFIKVPFAGGTYKEVDSNIRVALENQEKLKLVIRGLDMQIIFWDKDRMREDMGEYPTYLFNKNIFDDVYYICNKEIWIKSMGMIIENLKKDRVGGITTFDEYSNWTSSYSFGANVLLSVHEPFTQPEQIKKITFEEKKAIKDTIEQNVLQTASKYPDVKFYIFFPPYSAVAWGDLYQQGEVEKYINAEQYAIELMLPFNNIYLFSYNTCKEITFDLNNYRDPHHYGEWINSEILKRMAKGEGLLTEDNYKEYIKKEYILYNSYEYNSLFQY